MPAPTSRLRVLLVDAQPLQREGWRLVLEAQPDLEVVAEAGDGVAALGLLRTVQIDVVLSDVRLSRLGGLQLVELVAADARVRLMQRLAPSRIVLVTATDLDRYAPLGLAAGAAAVLWKDTAPEALLAAIRTAAAAPAA